MAGTIASGTRDCPLCVCVYQASPDSVDLQMLSPTLIDLKRKRPSVVKSTVKLVHGDCVAGMRKLRADSVSLVLADPPYAPSEQQPDTEYLEFSYSWLREAVRLLRPGGTLLYFASPCALWSARLNLFLADQLGMRHVQTLAWAYKTGGDARLDGARQYAVRHETLEYWCKGGVPTFNAHQGAEPYTAEQKKQALQKGVGRVNSASLDVGRPPKSWLEVARENSPSRERSYGPHPTMKPLLLAERLVGVHSCVGDLVVVPFSGSATELLVSAKMNRSVVAFEIEEAYITMSKARAKGHGVEIEIVA